MMTDQIRPARAPDAPILKSICAQCGLFTEEELPFMEADIDAWAGGKTQRLWFVAAGMAPQGAAMLASEEMSDNVWNMLFIGVAAAAQGKGLGRALLHGAEQAARARAGRILLIDTASTADFLPARKLYESAGYDQEAVLRDYYGDGIDRVTFAKRLVSA